MRKLLVFILILSSLAADAQQQKILVPFRVGDKWGYSDTLGKLVVQPKYDLAEPFSYTNLSSLHQPYAIVVAGGIRSVLNTQGKVVFSGKYEKIWVNNLVKGVSFIVTNAAGKRGVFNSAKQPLIPVVHEHLVGADNDSYIIYKKEKYGLINGQGKLIIPVIYDDISPAFPQDEKTFTWEAVKDGNTKIIKDRLIVRQQSGGPQFLTIVPDDKIAMATEKDWKGELYKKWQPDSIVEVDDDAYHTRWILYKRDKQAIFVENNIPAELSFFDKAYGIKNIYMLDAGSSDHGKYNASFLLHVTRDGKEGLITEKSHVVVPLKFDEIYYGGEQDGLKLREGVRYGMYIFNTVYPWIPARYDDISAKLSIPVNSAWNFAIYPAEKNGKNFYVGENGVEYYSEK